MTSITRTTDFNTGMMMAMAMAMAMAIIIITTVITN
jgi:hypothetical protein